MNCEEYVVEKLNAIEEDNDCLKFQINNVKRCLNVANNKLDTARKIIAKFMDISETGRLYITSIWEWKKEFNELLEALDIPMTAEQAANEAVEEVLDNDNNINPYQE